MSTRLRQLIFIVVLTLSVVGLSWILLYSSGYSINWLTWTVQPTSNIRLAVEPNEGSYILLLPNGLSSNDGTASFTHLAPGDYHLHIEAPDYLPVNLSVTTKANSTLVFEPLRLWPDVPIHPTTTGLAPAAEPIVPADLPIAFQAALAQLSSDSDQNQFIVGTNQVVVLDAVTQQATLLSQLGGVMTSRLLDNDTRQLVDIGQPDQIALLSDFSISLVSLSTDQFTTLIRVSTPIIAAVWISETPYIAYADAHSLHILDSRSQTNYSDQVVATLAATITAVEYNSDLDSIVISTTAETLLYPLTVDK
ncbi:MAG: hypothetical protein HY565_00270 [Candidatus Kerfeldbacteria bacterium]|nr:hypothetical protein [Candidatus Kerfeldbacteria bacterium]